MRAHFAAIATAACALAPAQYLDSVYHRDSGTPFQIEKVHAYSHVRGPLVKTVVSYRFTNPHKGLAEASLNLRLPWGAALSGFGYWYKDEYVPGQLMDRNMAWFIYTAITSRDRDPGIMDQVAPDSYHAQIYPLAVGFPLRVQLTSVGFLNPGHDRLSIPEPTWPAGDREPEFEWKVDSGGRPLITSGNSRAVPLPEARGDLNQTLYTSVLAERWRDGNVYVAGMVMGAMGRGKPQVSGLRLLHTVRPVQSDPLLAESTLCFVGVATGPQITVRQAAARRQVPLRPIVNGSDAAQVWAQARLTEWPGGDVLAFSLKYNVPSRATALLAVPTVERALFEQKRKEYLAKLRREKAEMARARSRPATSGRGRVPAQANWNASRGGDPEILVREPDAQRVIAILPDGRVLALRKLGDGWWTINFDIPADAPEGQYRVRIVTFHADGTRKEQSVEYTVDRTAPTATARWDGPSLVVESEPGLARVEAYARTGVRLLMREVAPGRYQLEPPPGSSIALIVTVDRASNKSRLPCPLR